MKEQFIRRHIAHRDLLKRKPESFDFEGWVVTRLEERTDEDAQKALTEVRKSREGDLPADWTAIDFYGHPVESDGS